MMDKPAPTAAGGPQDRSRAPRRRCFRRAGRARRDRARSNDLCLFYGRNQALKNITIDFPRNQVTALIGPSGCGKSTLLRCLNRMNDLIDDIRTTGSILVDGQEILDRSTDVIELRQKVGMVFQKPTPFAKIDLRERGLRPADCRRPRPPHAGRGGGEEPAAGRPVGRGQGPPAPVGPRAFRRPAPAVVHRPGRGRASGDHPHGRALFGA